MSLFGKPKYATNIKNDDSLENKNVKIPVGIFEKCKSCEESFHKDEWKKNIEVCPECGYHKTLPSARRIELLTDEGTFLEVDSGLLSIDILKFEGVTSYTEKLEQNRKKTGLNDAVVCGTAKLNGIEFALGLSLIHI